MHCFRANTCAKVPRHVFARKQCIFCYHFTLWLIAVIHYISSLSPAEAPTGYTNKNSYNQKIAERAVDDRKRKRRKPPFSLFLTHRPLRTFMFTLPSIPTTQRGLCGGESDISKQIEQRARMGKIFALWHFEITFIIHFRRQGHRFWQL